MPADAERVYEVRASTGVGCDKAAEVATAYDAAIMGEGEFPDSEPVPGGRLLLQGVSEGARLGGDVDGRVHRPRLNDRLRLVWGV